MKKIIKILTGICLVFLILMTVLAYRFFYSMKSLPEGKQIAAYPSPDQQYCINLYLVNSHSTVAPALRGELVTIKTGKAINIYWDYRLEQAEVKWESSSQVEINGHLISLPNGYYDFRRDR